MKIATTTSRELPEGRHTLTVLASEPVLINFRGQPLSIASGRFKTTLSGSGVVEIDNPNKAKVSMDVATKGVSTSEQIDDRELPAPPDPSNILQMLRMRVRQDMGVQREAFGEIISPYETDKPSFDDPVIEAPEPQTEPEPKAQAAEPEPNAEEA